MILRSLYYLPQGTQPTRHAHHTPHSSSPTLKPVTRTALLTQPNHSMSYMSKAEIIEEIARLGELPPKSWNRTECMIRMEELRTAHGLTPNPKAKTVTPLRTMMVQLNAAATKKANLVTFVKELGVVVAPNDTIPILQKKGALAIYDQAPASPEDPVGFGMHAAKTYQEILVHEASYQRWVIQTFEEQEGQACARLCRLARWLLDQRAQKDMTPMNDTHAPAPITREELMSKGYKTTKVEPDARSKISKQSGASSSTTQSVLVALVETVQELKEEVSNLKGSQGEPPRKKAPSSSEASAQSFEMVQRP